ncbi:MAG: transcription-repair coupling factor [Deltaproteobacteria bacterium]|nr:transcription-repair coupling factor [Deltaproteobacteria bacterium]
MLNQLLEQAAHRLTQSRTLRLTGLRGGGLAWAAAALAARHGGPVVLLTHGVNRAEALAEDLAFYAPLAAPLPDQAPPPVYLFPQWDTVPYDSFSPAKEVMALRMVALHGLQRGGPCVVVTTPQAWMQGMIPLVEFSRLVFDLHQGGQYPRAELITRILQAGYVRVDLVEAPGEFSARGEILDVFSPQWEHPLRLDFFDDTLESLRWFEVSSQKSIQEVTAATLFPAGEGVVNAENSARALRDLPHHKGQMQPELYRQLYSSLEQRSAFPGSEQMLPLLHGRAGWLEEALPAGTALLLDEPARLDAMAEAYYGEVLGEFELNLNQGTLSLPPERFYRSPAQWRKDLAARYRVDLEPLRLEEDPQSLVCPFADNSGLRMEALGAGTPHQTLDGLFSTLSAWRQGGAPVLLAARSDTGAERLRHLLGQFELAAPPAVGDLAALPSPMQPPGPPRDFLLLTRSPSQGFRLVDEQGQTCWALVTEEELLGEKARQRRMKKSSLQHFLASLGELKEGDLVVHVEYGIGRYEGLRKIAVGGEEGDFLVLHYAGEDKVYVPVYKFHQVQRYTGVEGGAPPLNRLGDGVWLRTKQRTSKVVEDIAEELVDIYAARKARAGHAYGRHEGMMAEFEEAFPFQETEDQERTIKEVMDDLCSEMPMDRLVCGDVGFGKTEVALRAAFLAALEGRQTLVLVPTTILAQQHFDTFKRRFEGFAVKVDMISRFRSAREQKEVAKKFSEGQVDVLIGTHRLFSQDIQPKNLGLLVIDEEQRFGVTHKERIKKLRLEVEVLTLSATPIPRTLHMSLMGVRDLSVINTAPMDRIAVRTRLVKSSDYIITEAVERELRRGGQVFIVHNRVETIHQYGSYLKTLLPHLKLGIAHGQMPERQLEEVMLGFVTGELEVLLSTTIVESGLDIPRANTILINHADHFGLAQLYQLRGRVGRSNVQAYAYLLVSPEKMLTDVAQKRLTLLQELNDLGSGFKIASHDLEIRGAGNLLGQEQSGHINAVGLELFTQMVEEAVGRLKGSDAARLPPVECRIDLGFPYLLPEDFIAGTQQRLEVYKQLADLRSEESLWELRQVLEDRFGAIPGEVDHLLDLIRIRLLALSLGLSVLERSGHHLQARFGRPEWIDLDRLMRLVNTPDQGFQILPNDRLLLGPMPQGPRAVLDRLRRLETVIVRPQAA